MHEYTIAFKDVTIPIAPGVTYQAWTFEGGAPGPTIHVRQGDTVKVTLRNEGMIPHSLDFHAARIAPTKAFVDVKPGEEFSFEFVANDPGVFMYHCGTPPVLAHIANGMYGAIVVDPEGGLPPADREYVLVGSEWYLNGDGKAEPATIDMEKARGQDPDYVTWNGFAGERARGRRSSTRTSTRTGSTRSSAMDGTTTAQFQNVQSVDSDRSAWSRSATSRAR